MKRLFSSIRSFFRRFKRKPKVVPLTIGLEATRRGLGSRLGALFTRSQVDTAFLAELESTLISADVGMGTVAMLLKAVQGAATPESAKELLRKEMVSIFRQQATVDHEHVSSPLVGEGRERGGDQVEGMRVILILGVNGVGKTTSIAKLARQFQNGGKKILLAAGDTFRAAAIDQLKIWGERLGCDVVAQDIGADSASVAFDAVSKAKARGYDVVLIDTAGRLHTKSNLMEELKKIDRVTAKAYPGAPHERWLVIDATVGQNGLNQAREFHAAFGLTGIIITKLDGTAKGGIVCSVAELGIPIVSIGIGEGMDDLRPFDPQAFVDAILG